MQHTVDPEKIPAAAGAYALLIELPRPTTLTRFPDVTLPTGNYVYCGSAYGPGGLRARIARHLRQEKPMRWHLDFMTRCGTARTVLAQPGGNECALMAALIAHPGTGIPIPGFGSSDCRQCPAHLAAVPENFDLARISVETQQ